MADKNIEKNKRLLRRKNHVRNSVTGTAKRPRLSVYRSNLHIYAQVIDDVAGKTLASASSRASDVLGDLKNGGNVAAAKRVGAAIAARAVSAGITMVGFDRGGRKYHGRIKALAEAAREAGLKF